ncbi:MAG: hypothetical protein AAGF12_25950 [Myxococcota bacterium]
MASRLFGKRDSERPSARALARDAKRASDPEQAATLYTKAGRMSVEEGKDKRAIGYFEAALSVYPLHRPASVRLIELHRRLADAVGVLREQTRWLEALAQARADARHLSAAHLELAETAHRSESFDLALVHYRSAFELDPVKVDAIEAARRIAFQIGRFAMVGELIEVQVSVTSSPARRAELFRAAGLVLRDNVEDIEAALAMFARAQDTDPANAKVRWEVARTLIRRAEFETDIDRAMQDRNAAADRLCQLVEMVSRDQQRAALDLALSVAPEHVGAVRLFESLFPDAVGDQIELWTKHLEAFPDGPISDDVRQRLSDALAATGDMVRASEELFPLAERGLLAPMVRLAELEAARGRVDAAHRWIEQALTGAPPEQHSLVRRRAFRALREAAPELALDHAEALLELDPEDDEGLRFCRQQAEVQRDFPRFVRVLSSLGERFELERSARLAHLSEAARVCEERLDDLSAALSIWGAAAEVADGDQGVVVRREQLRLADATGRWDELVPFLEQEIGDTSAANRVPLLERLAEVHARQRNDATAAVEVWLRLLGQEPEHSAALEGLRAFLVAGDGAEGVESTLRRLANQAGRRGAAIYRLLGEAADRFERNDEALAHWRDVLAYLPKDAEALGRVADLALETNRDELAREMLRTQIAGLAQAMRREPRQKLATLLYERFGDLEGAADVLKAAVDDAPEDLELREEFAAALRRAERFEEELVVVRSLANAAPNPIVRRAALERIARVKATHLRDPAGSLRVWKEIGERIDDHTVLDEMIDDAVREEAFPRADVLMARGVELSSGDEAAERMVRRAELLAELLEDREGALSLLRGSARGAGAAHLPTLSYLQALAEAEGDDAALAHALELQLPLVPVSARTLYYQRLTTLLQERLGDPIREERLLRAWETAVPTDAAPRERLIEPLAASEDWPGLLERVDELIALVPPRRRDFVELVFAAVADPPGGAARHELAWLHIELAKRSRSKPQRIELLDRAAEHFEAADSHREAFAAAVQCLILDGASEARLANVERLGGLSNAVAELDSVYQRMVREGKDERVRRMVILRHIDLLTVQNRRDDALDELLRATALQPTDDELLTYAEALAGQTDRVDELFGTYAERMNLVGSGEQAVTIALRALDWADRRDSGRERRRFIDLAVRLAGSERQLQRIEAHAEQLGAQISELLVATYEAIAENEGAAGAALLVRSARVLGVRGAHSDTVVSYLVRALELAPTSALVMDRCLETAKHSHLLPELDRRLEAMIEKTIDDETAAALLRGRGVLLRRDLGDPKEAVGVFGRLVALRPDDRKAFSDLVDCLRKEGDLHELIGVTERALMHRSEGADRLGLLKNLAELWEEVGQRYEALAAWKRALKEAPDDPDAPNAIVRLEADLKGSSTEDRGEEPVPEDGS